MALPSRELPEQALDALIVRERTRVVAPLTEWRTLGLQLRDEGLLHAPGQSAGYAEKDTERGTHAPGRRSVWRTGVRWTARMAASVALVGAGVLAGRTMTFVPQFMNNVRFSVADSTDGTSVHVSTGRFASPTDARKALVRSQTEYQRAAAYLAATDTGARIATDPEVYRGRLAALDEMTNATMNALKDAPEDPLLNQYYLSAAAAREATLQQLGNSLPVGTKMVRF